jgi:hypothetical protein
MPETTDIEKKSLEAHVELCAERYRHLETKLETVESKITGLGTVIREVHDMMISIKDRRNNQIIAWGGSLVVMLLGVIAWFFVRFVA